MTDVLGNGGTVAHLRGIGVMRAAFGPSCWGRALPRCQDRRAQRAGPMKHPEQQPDRRRRAGGQHEPDGTDGVPAGLLDAIADACIAFDRSWRVTFVNRQGEVLLGRTRADVIGSVLWDLGSDVLPAALQSALEQARAVGVPQTVEVEDRPRGRWLEVRCHPSADGVFVLALDVTSRRVRDDERASWAKERAQDARRASALLDLVTALGLQDTVQDVAEIVLTKGFSLVRPDAGSVFLLEGDLLHRIAVTGRIAELAAHWPAVHLDSTTPVAQVARSGEVLAIGGPEELERAFPDASTPLRAGGAESSLILPLVARDRVMGVVSLAFRAPREFTPDEVGFARTVAAQAVLALSRARAFEAERAAAAEAAASAAVLDALVNAAPTGLAVLDTDLRWVLINEHLADINGLPVADHLGRTPWQVVPDLANTAVPMFQHILETGEPMLGVELEGETPKAPGVTRQWVEHFFPVRGADGTTLGLGVVAEEVTERRAVEAARQRAVRRTERLADAAAGLARALTTEEVAAVLEGQAVDGVGAVAAVLSAGSADAPPDAPPDAVEAFHSASLRRGAVIDPDGASGWVVHIPVVGAGAPVGVLTARFAAERDVHPEDEVFLSGLAAMGGPALERAGRFEREHSIAATLQHALLPHAFPHGNGLRIEARYLPGAEGVEVGGDWYDVVRTVDRDGTPVMLASLGDVVGKGLHAATVMGQIRSAARGFAALDPSPDVVLASLDRLFTTMESDEMATLALAAIHPDGTASLALAGHLPPLLLLPDGAVQLLEGGRSMPLGAGPGGRLAPVQATVGRTPAATVPFPPGSTLVLYSDGLIESARLPVTEGLEQLEALASSIARMPTRPSPGELADLLTAGMVGVAAQTDDVAVLVIERLVTSHRAELELPAGPKAAGSARSFAREWWSAAVASVVAGTPEPDDGEDLVLVVSELVTNGLRHANGAQRLDLELMYDAGTWCSRVGVTDGVRGPQPRAMMPGPEVASGRGLGIVADLSVRWGVEGLPGGKRVWADLPLTPGGRV
jgi:PAS domain S-box-containing protein